MDGIPGDLREWDQHEGSLVHSRMRDDQVRFVDDAVAIEKQIEVERARRVWFGPDSAELPLDAKEQLKEVFGGTSSLDAKRH